MAFEVKCQFAIDAIAALYGSRPRAPGLRNRLAGVRRREHERGILRPLRPLSEP